MQICRNCFKEYEGAEDACPFCGYAQSSDKREVYHLPAGMLFRDRYILGRVLGYGGFSNTYKAWDKINERVVIVNEYFPSGLVSRVPGCKEVIVYSQKNSTNYSHGKELFLKEAEIKAHFIAEPGIVDVYDFFEENNTAYVVREMLEGITLKKYLAGSEFGRLDYKESCKIILQVAEALKALHEKWIIHGEVNPENIFICNIDGEGNVKLLIDYVFGRFSKAENYGFTGILAPGYAPCEQYCIKNRKYAIGPWTDVYALGAVMYCMITGIRPEESINRKVKDTVLYPHEIDSTIPKQLSKAIMKAMAVDTRKRYKKVEAFARVIRKFR